MLFFFFLFLLLDHFERLTANTQSKCFIDLLDNYLKMLQRNQLCVCVCEIARSYDTVKVTLYDELVSEYFMISASYTMTK